MSRQDDMEAAIWAAIDKIVNKTERLIAANYRQSLDEVRGMLGKLYEAYAESDGTLTYAEMAKYHRLKSLHDQLVDLLGPTLSKDGQLVGKLARVVYEESFYRYGWLITETAGVDAKWGLLRPGIVQAAIDKPYSGLPLSKVWTRAKAGALSDIERAIIQGTVQGDSYPNMARRVRSAFETNANRAMLIARTEGHRMAVEGQLYAYERADKLKIAIKRIWDATMDARTRPEHAEMNGKAAENVADDEAPHWQWFYPSIGWVDGPGLTGVASADINCRCRVTPVVEGYEPADASEEVRKYQEYNTWANTQGIK